VDDRRVAVLFPGQGAYYPGALADAYAAQPLVRETFEEIDAVARPALGRTVVERLFGSSPPAIEALLSEAPDVLQLAIYGLSVATYRLLETGGLRPAVLVGHSFGEIGALVCAGAFTVRQGAEIVLHRMAALSALGDAGGYMAALALDASRARRLLDLVGDERVAVAVENTPQQTVVSGPAAAMDTVAAVAKALGASSVRLRSPYPFHSPLLDPAVADFAARLRDVPAQPPRLPVFSPILGRHYAPDDDLGAALAEHFVRPVRFGAAVRRLHEDGIGLFVEAGALETLGKLVRQLLPDDQVTAVACLDPALGDARSLQRAQRILTEYGAIAPADPPVEVVSALLPGLEPSVANAFWAARGAAVLDFVRRELRDFPQETGPREAAPEVGPPPAAAAPAAPAAEGMTRAALFAELTATYAAALEYPEEVFTDEVELEAELGVDSVKQTELLAQVAERYGLPPRPADFRLSDYKTMGQVTDFVFAALDQGKAA
jgi:acyl transferase domain-containing protein/acyl carrier protein